MITRNLLFLFAALFCFIACSEANTSDRMQLTGSDALAQEEDTVGLPSAVFAGGCFWCTEAYFERLKGVKAVISGYSGGKEKKPTYRQVSSGLSDHAEAVQVYYNPSQITYQELLEVFFATHDPTTLNRQGPDVGKQYRSIVFYKTPEEKKQAEAYIKQLEEAGTYKNKIVTHVQPLDKFWIAEEYHQDYYRRNPQDPYVVSVARPKVRKFEDNYRSKLKREYIE
ncbi:peptide-methionine (S)-S-oxide reductase MsrA [Pontibacter flavimaris]|uniref:Peptide methionine sulfoxide reductase MsrA n=1 Tax=Pontibacter flavimaris TaxID=1797110 RepID=A0A1Q5PGX3_9BACT|nr:peptide-methionine (S)-S-oxide reductase MsrA [Pontibacter flavimaris]OKL41480.1 peptide-methionine (S)-S-oxide reductase [Pontibacter flavimaris]